MSRVRYERDLIPFHSDSMAIHRAFVSSQSWLWWLWETHLLRVSFSLISQHACRLFHAQFSACKPQAS